MPADVRGTLRTAGPRTKIKHIRSACTASLTTGDEAPPSATVISPFINHLRGAGTPYKTIDSENFIKVSQNPNKVARDAQGLPTVPHNDFGGLNFKGLASKYLFLMTTSPYKITFSQKKNRTRGTLTSEKTSDSALSGGCGVDIWSSFLFCVSSF